MSPPGPTATLNERRNTCAAPRETLTVEVLARETGELLKIVGVERSRQWINRTARAYLRSRMQGRRTARHTAGARLTTADAT